MPQQHLDRLTALDASFLHQEGPQSHMHIGALAICEGPPPSLEELVAHVGGRLHLVPRYRQRLAHTAFDRGRPVWIDDPGFRIDFHVSHAALPSPGGDAELREMVARIFSTALDRTRPLWELWFVEGLADGRFALIFKSHHALIDGIAGVDLATVVFDLDPAGADRSAPPSWRPARNPGSLELVAVGAASVARGAATLARIGLAAARRPQRALARARTAALGVGEVVWETLNPAPQTPLNVPIGPHRRYATASFALADFKLVKDAFGATVNDVLLAVTTGALRRFLGARGIRTEGLELRALVPVSIRAAGDGATGELGNRLAAMRAPLPVHIADPVARLAAVRASMDGIKHSRQALGAEVLAGVQNFAPPTLLAQASRLNFTTRLFNLLVTNVPGPQIRLHVLGRAMAEAYPIAFLPRDHALSVAILSYDGRVNFGLLGDHDALPELDRLTGWVREELDALIARAGERIAAAAGPAAQGGPGAPRLRSA
jgi:WS/DGAT/MGAT family acyltransferase